MVGNKSKRDETSDRNKSIDKPSVTSSSRKDKDPLKKDPHKKDFPMSVEEAKPKIEARPIKQDLERKRYLERKRGLEMKREEEDSYWWTNFYVIMVCLFVLVCFFGLVIYTCFTGKPKLLNDYLFSASFYRFFNK